MDVVFRFETPTFLLPDMQSKVAIHAIDLLARADCGAYGLEYRTLGPIRLPTCASAYLPPSALFDALDTTTCKYKQWSGGVSAGRTDGGGEVAGRGSRVVLVV